MSSSVVKTPEVDETVGNSDVVNKYRIAGEIANEALSAVKALAVEGADVTDLCAAGDAAVAAAVAKVYRKQKKLAKGLSFPTCVSVNDCVAHFAPQDAETLKLKNGDVAKIEVGAHIDGYPSIIAETIIVGGESKATDAVRNAIAAAYYATEAALRTVKVGARNWDVTSVVEQVAKDYNCVALEGMLSQEHGRNVVDGKKKIIFNPSEQQRRDFEASTFAENEVYGLDILLAPAPAGVDLSDATAARNASKTVSKLDVTPTTVYKKNSLTYQLKLRTSRAAISEVQAKAGTFPFNLNVLSDQRRARVALKEPMNHGLVTALDVSYAKSGEPVVALFTTFALTRTGVHKLAAPAGAQAAPAGSRVPNDATLAELVAKPLRETK